MESTITTLEDSVKTENRTITLVPRYGLQQGAIFVEPVPDGNGGFKGIPFNWEELRKNGKATSTPDDSFKFDFPSGKQYLFDLSNPQVAQRWAWMKHSPVIALSKDAASGNPNALIHVEDAEAELIKIVTVKKTKFELEAWVRELPSAEQAKICRLLGQRTEHMKPIDIEDYLVEKARSGKYTELRDLKEDKFRKTKLFLYELEDKRLITKYHKGYKFGDLILGLDMESCIHWLNQMDNKELVMQWKNQLHSGFEQESLSFEDSLANEPKRSAGRPPKKELEEATNA